MSGVLAAILMSTLLGDAHVIQDVEPMQGVDPTLPALARAIRIAEDPQMTDAYLFGVTGAAFLATVCSNNCNCREWRELSLRIDPTLKALGVQFEKIDGNDDKTWAKVKASIDDGVPVVLWNLFGDFEDSLLCGYDLEKDTAYGWGVPAAKEYLTAKLSAFRQGGMMGYIVKRANLPPVDRRNIELESLRDAVLLDRRPPIEGG